MDYLGAIRPETETVNQTLRMLGTYPTDQAHADKMGTFIAAGCPGAATHTAGPAVRAGLGPAAA